MVSLAVSEASPLCQRSDLLLVYENLPYVQEVAKAAFEVAQQRQCMHNRSRNGCELKFLKPGSGWYQMVDW